MNEEWMGDEAEAEYVYTALRGGKNFACPTVLRLIERTRKEERRRLANQIKRLQTAIKNADECCGCYSLTEGLEDGDLE